MQLSGIGARGPESDGQAVGGTSMYHTNGHLKPPTAIRTIGTAFAKFQAWTSPTP